jgi:hypothetical protein
LSQRFSVKDPQQHLWYYRPPRDVDGQGVDNWLLDELPTCSTRWNTRSVNRLSRTEANDRF